ncbi:hypothetical protein [Aestuariivita sp.]|uniref:hypothetical protein n=1 Tax=Aestuariivita sp. TaxID=1872407 RepID=UPI002173E74D|nr:hypothetical protein [Aestuariivita sp.]MCE8007272.1 hypothetical protein [Aestuariivita sp.]
MLVRLTAIVVSLTLLAACTPGQFGSPDPLAVAAAQGNAPKYADTPAERRAIYRGSRAGVASR